SESAFESSSSTERLVDNDIRAAFSNPSIPLTIGCRCGTERHRRHAMNTRKTPQGIEVRKIQFPFPSDFHPHWNPDDPALSQLVNGASMLLPYMEPFIIDCMREATKQVSDPALLEEARGWIAQEAHHFAQHRRFNEVLVAHGYPQLRQREK